MITDQNYTLARAYPKTRKRASGWHDWFCLTMCGEPTGCTGSERSKSAAMRAATAEAARINAAIPRSNSRHIRVDQVYASRRMTV